MIDRSKAPLPSGLVSFELPEIKQIILSNGIKVFFVHKNNLPIIYTTILLEAGSKFDPAEKKGLAYLTSLLIDEGAGEFDALQLSNEFEKLGSVFSISADQDFVNLSLLSLTENYGKSFSLVSTILTNPRFEENDFTREKKKVLDRILQLKDDAGYIASTIFEKLVLENSFYELPEIGYQHTVESITNIDVKDFYKKFFSNNKAQIVTVGNLSVDELTNTLEKDISKWNSSNPIQSDFTRQVSKPNKYYIIDKKDSAQCEIRVGHIAKKRTSPDFYANRLMNSILGGQFSSRINLNLREDKGFTYGASSVFSYYKECGLFEVHTAVNIENSIQAVQEILKEIDGIRTNITDKEIEFAKSYLVKQYPSRFETFTQIAKSIESIISHSLPFDELNTYVSKIENLSNNDILEAARENINPDELIVVLCGEREKIAKQLQEQLGVEAVELSNEGIPL